MIGSEPLTVLPGIGPAVAQKYAILGLHTIDDLIDYYPRRYEDYSRLSTIDSLQPGMISISAIIVSSTGRYVRRGMHITEAVANDATGSVRLVWFNQPYRATALKVGQQYYISGIYELKQQRFVIQNPNIELTSDIPANAARILPVYRETKGLTSRQIRVAIRHAEPVLRSLPESLPPQIISRESLMSRAEALTALHIPESSEQLEIARRRLGFEEVFQLSLASILNKRENRRESALAISFNEDLARNFVKHLPFNLTDAQRRVIWQIYLDLQKTEPMNRLVEGDVGSG